MIEKLNEPGYLAVALVSVVAGFLLSYKKLLYGNEINVAKLVSEMLRSYKIESEAKIKSLELENKRLLNELQEVWNKLENDRLECAKRLMEMELKFERLDPTFRFTNNGEPHE